MKVLLDSNAYSLLMRGHGEVAGLVRRAEELLFLRRRGWRTDVWLPARQSVRAERRRPALISRQPLLVLRRSGPGGPRRSCSPPLWLADGHFEHVEGIVWVRVAAA